MTPRSISQDSQPAELRANPEPELSAHALLDELAASVTPQRIRQALRSLHRDPRWKAQGAVPFYVLVERLAGTLGSEGSSQRWQAQARVRDALHAVLPQTAGVVYSPPT